MNVSDLAFCVCHCSGNIKMKAVIYFNLLQTLSVFFMYLLEVSLISSSVRLSIYLLMSAFICQSYFTFLPKIFSMYNII